MEDGTTMFAVECKAGATVSSDWLDATGRVAGWLTDNDAASRVVPVVVHGGDLDRNGDVTAIGWRRLADAPWAAPPASVG